MKYLVVPFIASLPQNNSSGSAAADQLQAAIDQQVAKGWNYVRLESVTTWIAPDSGCFGFGGKPGYVTSKQVIVFEKQE